MSGSCYVDIQKSTDACKCVNRFSDNSGTTEAHLYDLQLLPDVKLPVQRASTEYIANLRSRIQILSRLSSRLELLNQLIDIFHYSFNLPSKSKCSAYSKPSP